MGAGRQLEDRETGDGPERAERPDHKPLSRPRSQSRDGPAKAELRCGFRVLIDGQPPGAAYGLDVDAQGNGTASDQRCYQLIRQPKPIDDRNFEIEFLDRGIEAYILTFG